MKERCGRTDKKEEGEVKSRGRKKKNNKNHNKAMTASRAGLASLGIAGTAIMVVYGDYTDTKITQRRGANYRVISCNAG